MIRRIPNRIWAATISLSLLSTGLLAGAAAGQSVCYAFQTDPVSTGSGGTTANALTALGARWEERRGARGTLFLIANPRGLTAEERPFVGQLPVELQAAGVEVRSLALR
jgi:hypothetical protein